AVCIAQQQNRSRQLPGIEPGEGSADPAGLAVAAQIVGQKCVGREIHGVHGAEHEAEATDQRTAPVGPPAPTFPRHGASATIARAITATGALQNAKPHCQLPPTSGKTMGNISATGASSPISRPLV